MLHIYGNQKNIQCAGHTGASEWLSVSIEAVLFDMDGTLIDTEKHFRTTWPAALKRFGYEMTDEQALQMRSLGRPFAPRYLKSLFGESFDYDKVREYRKKIMEEALCANGIEVKPGAGELLVFLQKRRIKTVVVTASDLERTRRYLRQTGLITYFDRLISATMVEKGKPAPDVYEYACAALKIEPCRCLAVEDSPNGVESAAKAGCLTVMIPDQTPSDERLRSMLYAEGETLPDIRGLFES